MVPLRFTVSSYCHGGGCVAVAALPGGGGVAVRDEKEQGGPVLEFTAAEWSAFVSGVRDGQFDLDAGALDPEISPSR